MRRHVMEETAGSSTHLSSLSYYNQYATCCKGPHFRTRTSPYLQAVVANLTRLLIARGSQISSIWVASNRPSQNAIKDSLNSLYAVNVYTGVSHPIEIVVSK